MENLFFVLFIVIASGLISIIIMNPTYEQNGYLNEEDLENEILMELKGWKCQYMVR